MSLDGGAARLPITIELGAGWDGDVRRVAASTFECLGPELHKLLYTLGLTGRPTVRVVASDVQRAVRLRVHGLLQQYPPELLSRAWIMNAPPEFLDLPQPADGGGPLGFPDTWLQAYHAAGTSNGELFGRFLAELTLEVVTAHPGCLVGPGQVAAFASDWRRGANGAQPLPDEEVERLLRRLVELGASVRERGALGEVVAERRRWGKRFEDAVEVAFARLRPRQIDVLLNPEDLRELTTDPSVTGPVSGRDPAVVESVHADLRELEYSVYFELGVRLPELVLTPSPQLPRGTVAVKVNHLVGRPVRSQPGDLGRVVWAEVVRSAGRLLSVEEVEYELYELHEAFPELVEAALTLIPLADLTRVLRGLLAERISVRDLRAILERLVQYGTVPVDPIRYAVLDQRLPEVEAAGLTDRWLRLLAFARAGSGLRNYLSSRYMDEQDRLRVVLVDPELEEGLLGAQGGPRSSHRAERRHHEQQREAIRQQVWTTLNHVGGRAGLPVLLVNSSAGRQSLRDIIADELPDLPILARAEIRPGVRLEPLFTIHIPQADVPTR